ncbi:MAG: hypothetical protein ACI8ZN_000562 [Bacteroidia bacterium]|jgi:hypothetical protein
MLSGCFRDDVKEPALPEIFDQINTSAQIDQVFYSLKNRRIVASNSMFDWDLAFACEKGKFSIKLNAAKSMRAYNTFSREIDIDYTYLINQSYALNWTYEHPGMTEGGCLGKWGDFSFENPQSYGHVYIIDRGFNLYLNGLRYPPKKMRVDGFGSNSYKVTFSDINGDNMTQVVVPKNNTHNYVYIELDYGSTRAIEPPKDEWDILFTPYIDSVGIMNSIPALDSTAPGLALYDGILINPHARSAAMVANSALADIDFFTVDGLNFSSKLNSIGNQWLIGSGILNRNINPEKQSFVIQDNERNSYALQLLNFKKLPNKHSELEFSFKNL